jgi:hypothetical protein
MSTKSTFKRIALVSVAALGLGILSVAPPASATTTTTAVTTTVTKTSATLLGTVDAPFPAGSAIALNVTAAFGKTMVSGDTATTTCGVFNPRGKTIAGVTLVETSSVASLLGGGADTGTVIASGKSLRFSDTVTTASRVVATLTIKSLVGATVV